MPVLQITYTKYTKGKFHYFEDDKQLYANFYLEINIFS